MDFGGNDSEKFKPFPVDLKSNRPVYTEENGILYTPIDAEMQAKMLAVVPEGNPGYEHLKENLETGNVFAVDEIFFEINGKEHGDIASGFRKNYLEPLSWGSADSSPIEKDAPTGGVA